MTMKRFKKMPLKKKAKVVLYCTLIPFAWLIDSIVKAVSYLLAKRKTVLACIMAVAMLVAIMPLSGITASAAVAATANPTIDLAAQSAIVVLAEQNGSNAYSTDGGTKFTTYTGSITLSGQTGVSWLKVTGGSHKITMNGAKINAPGDTYTELGKNAIRIEGGSVELTLLGSNEATASGENPAGIFVAKASTLTITAASTGSIYAKAGLYGAAIGGDKDTEAGTIIINGGTVTAYVMDSGNGAAIGGGYKASYKEITINDGTVKASSYFGAGIGGGNMAASGKITINGGTVTASSNSGSAIGTGKSNSSAGSITITGGIITTSTSYWGVGIGGYNTYFGTIKISGGTIKASGLTGIGVTNGTPTGTLEITGGCVQAINRSTTSAKPAQPTNKYGLPLQLATVNLGVSPDKAVTKLTVSGASYGINDMHTIGGKLYVYLPSGASVHGVQLEGGTYQSGEVLAGTSGTLDGKYYVLFTPPASYDYTGKAVVPTVDWGVTAAQATSLGLPAITVKYKVKGTASYMSGLPTALGTYEVYATVAASAKNDALTDQLIGTYTIMTHIDQDENGYYHISNAEQMQSLSAIVSNGNQGAKAILDADVSLDNSFDRVGTKQYPFTGEFDGNNHLITVNYNNTTSECVGGIFDYVEMASIHNFVIKGTIKTTKKFTGGVIGCVNYFSDKSMTVERVICDVDIISSLSGDNTSGGIVGIANGWLGLKLCGYTGTITATNGGTRFGGMCGWANTRMSLSNSYMAGTLSLSDYTDSALMARIATSNPYLFVYSGCYSYNPWGLTQKGTKIDSLDQVSSGELAYKLNSSYSGSIAYYQNLSNKGDAFPIPFSKGNDIVNYGYKNCVDTEKSYANGVVYDTPGHTYENGICTRCGSPEPEYMTAVNGVYQISTADQLYWFAAVVNDTTNAANQSVNAKLIADITINTGVLNNSGTLNGDGSGFRAWTAIGGSITKSFNGRFDGNGKTISGLYYNGTKSAIGLFGYIGSSAEIKNVTVADSYIVAGQWVGGIVGYNNGGSIIGCTHSGFVKGTNQQIGGICGYSYTGGSIIGCTNSGIVTSDRCYYNGGIVGMIYKSSVTDCANSATVGGSGTNYNGGIVGKSSESSITDSISSGNVSGVYDLGGICGGTYNDNITGCYYLSGKAIGGVGRKDTEGAVKKTAGQFASGEICWLLNGKTSENSVWYQSLAKGGDAYPVLKSSGGDTVYCGYVNCGSNVKTYANTALSETIPEHTGAWKDNGDGTHSRICSVCNKTETANHIDADSNGVCDDCGSELTTISVTIEWGAMEFTYTDASEGTWNPTTHTYENATSGGWTCDDGANKITVTSESNVNLTASFGYKNSEGVTVTGSFNDGTNPVTTALPIAKKEDTAQTIVVYLKLDGKPDTQANKSVMGTVTVTIGE